MVDAFFKVGTFTPRIHLADPKYNADRIIDAINMANDKGVKLLVFPELVITGYTCGDLFLHELLLDTVKTELIRIADETKACEMVSVIGAPLRVGDKLYNTAVVMNKGRFICIIPKRNLPNYGEFYEMRQFSVPSETEEYSIFLDDFDCVFTTCIEESIISCSEVPDLKFAVEICEDLWVANPPSTKLAEAGALIIANLSAGDEIIGKADYRKLLVSAQSAKTVSAYIYCGAGDGESTSDMVFSGHSFIYENGKLLAEKEPFSDSGLLITEIDLGRLMYDRRRMNTHANSRISNLSAFCDIGELKETELTRKFDRNPFVPEDRDELHSRAKDILMIQALGLKRRLEHIHSRSAVIGISGGLDSSLALLVCAKACDLMGVDRHFVHAVTMPCFGTTEHTKNNAVELCEALGVTLHTVNIADSVRQHFADIGHDEENRNVTYENAQARMRTLVLMDMANALNGIVVGTGDLSELALGWATYNGDHMSMYGVNASVPKTLVRYIIESFALLYEDSDKEKEQAIKAVLLDICDTPISPELLPVDENGNMTQKTESTIGKYDLHDFFIYHLLRNGFDMEKIRELAYVAFEGIATKEEVDDTLGIFRRRFYSQQFKRSCLPDGPKVGSVCISPRGDLRMPSDVTYE